MKLKTLALIAASSAMTLPALAIAADETEYLTLITNTATLGYKIGNLDQTDLTAKQDFFVDRKLVFSLTRTDAETETIDGNDATFTETYTVNNFSNAPIGIKLPSTLESTEITTVGDVAITDGFYKLAAGDTTATDDTLTITVTTTLTDDDISTGSVSYDFQITAVEPETVAAVGVDRAPGSDTNPTAGITAAAKGDAIKITTATTDWNNILLQTVGVTTVYPDGHPSEGDIDTGNSGHFRTESKKYTIQTPDLDLVKTALVTYDPITGDWEKDGNQPKAIPGATVRYTLTVTNSGDAKAIDIILTDDLSAFVNPDSKLIITEAANTSVMYDKDGVEIPNEQAEFVGNILTFPGIDVPAATFKDNGDLETPSVITATFEVVIK
jgi:uncharacterized repeat protein (TIGR01451 family)